MADTTGVAVVTGAADTAGATVAVNVLGVTVTTGFTGASTVSETLVVIGATGVSVGLAAAGVCDAWLSACGTVGVACFCVLIASMFEAICLRL